MTLTPEQVEQFLRLPVTVELGHALELLRVCKENARAQCYGTVDKMLRFNDAVRGVSAATEAAMGRERQKYIEENGCSL